MIWQGGKSLGEFVDIGLDAEVGLKESGERAGEVVSHCFKFSYGYRAIII